MQQTPSAFRTALKYALITVLASFILGIIMYITKMYLNSYASWLSYAVLLAGMFMAVKERRDKDLGGYITYGQAFNTGFLFCLITGLLSVVTSFIMIQYIAPDMINEILKMTEQNMVNKGMTDDQVQMAMDMTKKFLTPAWMAVWVVIGTLIMGVIFSLIIAAIMKKDRPFLPEPPREDVAVNG